MWFGFGLVLVGVLLLLNNLGILKGDSWGYIWPAAIILIGLSILFNKKERNPKAKILKEDKENSTDKKEAE